MGIVRDFLIILTPTLCTPLNLPRNVTINSPLKSLPVGGASPFQESEQKELFDELRAAYRILKKQWVTTIANNLSTSNREASAFFENPQR